MPVGNTMKIHLKDQKVTVDLKWLRGRWELGKWGGQWVDLIHCSKGGNFSLRKAWESVNVFKRLIICWSSGFLVNFGNSELRCSAWKIKVWSKFCRLHTIFSPNKLRSDSHLAGSPDVTYCDKSHVDFQAVNALSFDQGFWPSSYALWTSWLYWLFNGTFLMPHSKRICIMGTGPTGLAVAALQADLEIAMFSLSSGWFSFHSARLDYGTLHYLSERTIWAV